MDFIERQIGFTIFSILYYFSYQKRIFKIYRTPPWRGPVLGRTAKENNQSKQKLSTQPQKSSSAVAKFCS